MKTIRWVCGGLLAAVLAAQGATNDLASALQKGLFEEEANGNLGAAIQAYQSVANRFDQDRRLAATAIFRLGECYRKQGNTNDATAQFQRVLREFSDQSSLATLSRQSLVALGVAAAGQGHTGPSGGTLAVGTPAAPTTSSEAEEVKRIQALINDSPDLINAADPQDGTTPLHRAAQDGHLVVAQFLLDNGANTEAKDTKWNGRTPLHYAAAAGHKTMVELLLSKGANVQATDRNGLTPLHLAAWNGYRSVAESLLDHHAPVDAKEKDGTTPLLLAAAHGFRSVLELLLAHGADLNANASLVTVGPTVVGNYKGTALSIAVLRGDQSLAALLLAKGAKVDVVDNDGRTPLSHAAANRQASLVKLLLDAHASPNAGAVDLPLAMASWSGDLDIVKLLLAHGADPNTNCDVRLDIHTQRVFYSQGTACSAFYAAVSQNHPEVIKALIAAKADPNSLGPDGNPVLFQALSDSPTLQALLEGGADPNQRNADGNTALLVTSGSSLQHRARAIELLLAHGANPNLGTRTGETPLYYAIRLNDLDLVQALLKAGAEVNAKTTDGQTPLHVAVERGNAEIVNLLLDKGANPNARNNAGATPLDLAKNRASGPGMPPGAGFITIPQPGLPGGQPLALNYGWTAPGGRPQPQPGSESQTNIATLLRQHGALDDLPRMDAIELRRPSTHYSSTLSNHGGTDGNQITLAEAIGIQYALLAGSPDGDPDWRSDYSLLYGNSFDRSLPFPDLAHVLVRQPAPDLKKWQEKRVDLSPLLESGDCSSDIALSWGEVVDIPEQDHALDAHWSGFTAKQMQHLVKCLSREVEMVIKGKPTKVTLGPELERAHRDGARRVLAPRQGSLFGGDASPFRLITRTNSEGYAVGVDIRNVRKGTLWLKPALLNSGLVLASSDLSRVKVTRKDPVTGKKREWVFDCTDGKPSPLFWLREGDIIEVPERSDVYSSAAPDSSQPAPAQPLRIPGRSSDFSQRLQTLLSNGPALPPGQFQQRLQTIIRNPQEPPSGEVQPRLQNIIPKPQAIPRTLRLPATNPPAASPAPTGN